MTVRIINLSSKKLGIMGRNDFKIREKTNSNILICRNTEEYDISKRYDLRIR